MPCLRAEAKTAAPRRRSPRPTGLEEAGARCGRTDQPTDRALARSRASRPSAATPPSSSALPRAIASMSAKRGNFGSFAPSAQARRTRRRAASASGPTCGSFGSLVSVRSAMPRIAPKTSPAPNRLGQDRGRSLDPRPGRFSDRRSGATRPRQRAEAPGPGAGCGQVDRASLRGARQSAWRLRQQAYNLNHAPASTGHDASSGGQGSAARGAVA
jgi:hypothetical protein